MDLYIICPYYMKCCIQKGTAAGSHSLLPYFKRGTESETIAPIKQQACNHQPSDFLLRLFAGLHCWYMTHIAMPRTPSSAFPPSPLCSILYLGINCGKMSREKVEKDDLFKFRKQEWIYQSSLLIIILLTVDFLPRMFHTTWISLNFCRLSCS